MYLPDPNALTVLSIVSFVLLVLSVLALIILARYLVVVIPAGTLALISLAAMITFGILGNGVDRQQLIDQAKITYSVQLTQSQAGDLIRNSHSYETDHGVYVRLTPTTEQRVKLVKDGGRTALVRVGQPRQIKSPLANELPRPTLAHGGQPRVENPVANELSPTNGQ